SLQACRSYCITEIVNFRGHFRLEAGPWSTVAWRPHAPAPRAASGASVAEPVKRLAWDDFRLVNAIADARSLPAAARLLGINHSTVFRRLAQIEATLGLTLFERGRAGYALTPAGEEMVALAQQIDENIHSFTRKIAGQEIAPSGELRVT